ncbi:MAG: lipoprotein-releasing ABC transporter permease subunit [Pseudohongiellaceae bacterium]
MLDPALYIGRRYASLRSRNQLVSFISLLSVCGLALGVAILITVLSVMNGFDRELQQRILALVPHMTVNSSRNEPLMNPQQWQDIHTTLLATPGVTGSAPWLQLQGMLLANGRSKGILLNGIEPTAERSVSIIDDFVTAGSLDSLAAGDYRIAIGAGLAQQLELALGDSVMLVSTVVPITPMGEFTRQKSFVVGAIFGVGSEIDGNLALVHMQDAQRLYRLGDRIHGYRLRMADLFDVFRIQQQLLETLPAGLSLGNWSNSYGTIYDNIRMSKALVGLLLTMLVAVAAFNIVVSLVMVVRDKRGDIAILRTMGTSLGTIRRIFLVQGCLIGLIGTGVGLLLGIALALSVGSLVEWLEAVLGTELLSADIYPVNYLPSDIRSGDLALVCVLALLLSLAATLYPSARAAATRPVEILRHE